jgi:hypothetical protein
MRLPRLEHRFGPQESVVAQTTLVKKLGSPVPQSSAKPTVDGYREATLRPADQRRGEVALENAPQQPLPFASPDLVLERQSPSELDDAVVEQRDTSLKACSHTRSVHFHESVSWQIARQVAVHHAIDGPRERRLMRRDRFATADHE